MKHVTVEFVANRLVLLAGYTEAVDLSNLKTNFSYLGF